MLRFARGRLSQFGRQPHILVRRPKLQSIDQTPVTPSAPIPKSYSRSSWDQPQGFSWAQRHTNLVVGPFVGICVAVWAWHAREVSSPSFKTDKFGRTYRDGTRLAVFYDNFVMSKSNIDAGRWWTMISSSFTHINLLHLAVNMVGVWQVGKLVVFTYGPATFGLIWISSTIAGDLLTLYWSEIMDRAVKSGLLTNPIAPSISEGNHIGASGSLCGLLGVAACTYPRIFRGTAIGVTAFSIVCLAGDFLPQFGHVSHMGGLASGAAIWLLFLSRRGPRWPPRLSQPRRVLNYGNGGYGNGARLR